MSSQTNVSFLPFKRNALGFFLILSMLGFVYPSYAQAWKSLSPGIEYQDIEGGLFRTPWSHIHVFRIDLSKQKLALITAKSLGFKNASAEEFARLTHAQIAINGGFFDDQFNALGLRIMDQKMLNPLKKISWWGIFYTQNNHAHITSLRHFSNKKNIALAIQAGPRLLVKGKIPSLKPGIADRTALGLTAEGQLILLVSTAAAMSTQTLAYLMKSPPLSCQNAINLDGGSSSQIYAHVGSFKLNVNGFSKVSDALLIF